MTESSTDLKKYQKMTDKEHILKKPDTYIGSIQNSENITYIFNPTTESIQLSTIHYIPGLYKLFDEGIVNARDHVVRQAHAVNDNKPDSLPVTYIEIDISDDGVISITNDGNGIDVAQHPEYKMWIPEMIFGHLRTSTNYDENKKEKIVGGKNGFGFKLVLIWSSWGSIETVDHTRQLKYIQEFKHNLDEICPPKITKSTVKPYTKVMFKPDYTRFGITNLSEDMIKLFTKRVYDIAAVTDKSIRVKFNGKNLPVKHFQQYIDLYIGGKGDSKRIYENPDERWEYAVCMTPTDEFCHVSFVNGIYTQKGGKHVDYIMNQITRKLTDYIKLKKKVDVKPASIREQLMLFLRCDIENPSFSSQSKDELGTPVASFGSSCKVSDDFIEKVAKMGVMDAACKITEVKETKAAKKTDGTKTRKIIGIPKLDDAKYAGTEQSSQCTIIFCEGDSAKAGIISGLSKDDRNYIGVYPMKGKLLNTRGEKTLKINGNNEISEIKQILGLESGKTYTQEDINKKLRYGKVLFMTDQDLDGSHIKGLGINMFHCEWPSLTEIPGFIGFMNTPILKAKKNTQELCFYNEGEYQNWKKEINEHQLKSWHIKYYKGLGTSTGKEFKEYFEKKKIVEFNHSGEVSDNAIDLVFNKKRSDDRKDWLATYSRDIFLDTSKPKVSYEEFIDREFKQFSKYDCDRSIPNVMDGLKICHRKILYSAFKKNLKNEIKVAQFTGYVSEHSGYHHGESSINGAIIGLAQIFVGSNNLNLFEPNGQFGCIDPETPVLMWDGRIEKAKNIKVNDKLVGDDGECRIVSKLTKGIDEMYEISNGNMDNYIVNSHHILTVSYSGHKSIFWKKSSNSWFMNYFDDNSKSVKCKSIRTITSAEGNHKNKSILSKEEAYNKIVEFSRTINDNNIFDINVQQYLALPNSVKKHIKGVINSSVIQWKEQDVPIDPYILGLWLGDGMSDCHAIAGMDSEIFKKHNLYKNKHIPPNYIINSKENRLKLLAGMIDTDGCLKKQKETYSYEISQSIMRKHILESFRIIAGSLGFRAKIYNTTDKIVTLSITGENIDEIPVKLPRKQIPYQNRIKNSYTHEIKIKSIGEGKFCGWNIDKNERFLLGDFTITHNTRLNGGKDHSSERYIFTQLNKLTRLIYRSEDDGILTYLDDDGLLVEPIYYVPIIPMVLVNGAKGIGTGFSTDVLCYDTQEVINAIKCKLNGEGLIGNEKVNMKPYYRGFKGEINQVNDTKYLIKGCYEIIGDKKVHVTELPIGTWTSDYKEYIESLIEPQKDKQGNIVAPALVKEYDDMSTDTQVDFTITMVNNMIQEYQKVETDHGCNKLEKILKLYTTESTTNMHLFDSKEKLNKYGNVYEIIDDYYVTRLEYYQKRKEYLLNELERELRLLSNRARYIKYILDDKLDLRKKEKSVIIKILKEYEFDMMDEDDDYKYLLKMPMDSVTEENVARILKEKGDKEVELEGLQKKSNENLWMDDIVELESEYKKWKEEMEKVVEENKKVKGKVKITKKSVSKLVI